MERTFRLKGTLSVSWLPSAVARWTTPVARTQLRDLPFEPAQVVLPLGLLRGHCCQMGNDRLALPQCIKGFLCLAALSECIGESGIYDTAISRCHPTLPASDFASRSATARLSLWDLSAPTRSPCAIRTSRTLRRTPRDRAASRRCLQHEVRFLLVILTQRASSASCAPRLAGIHTTIRGTKTVAHNE